MTRTIGLSALVVALLFAWQSYAVRSMVQACDARARAIIGAADPLDREPPPAVAAVIERNIPLARMVDYLATLLLDRYKCGGGSHWSGTEWLIEQPALSWHLRSTFSKSEVIALFASTADTGKNTVGINRSALRIYKRDVTTLRDEDISCLVWRSVATPFPRPVGAALPPVDNYPCADTEPVRPIVN